MIKDRGEFGWCPDIALLDEKYGSWAEGNNVCSETYPIHYKGEWLDEEDEVDER